MVAVPLPSSTSLLRQLHDWASRNGIMLFPRAYEVPSIAGASSIATRTVTPDGGFVLFALRGLDTLTTRVESVLVDNLQTGGRKLVEGSLRLSAFLNALAFAAGPSTARGVLPAPVVVLPGDAFSFTLACEVPGDTFVEGSDPTLVGYGLHDARTGAQLSDGAARSALDALARELGELRALGVAGAGAAMDVSASPSTTMSCDVVVAQGMAPTNTTAARLTLGVHELVPQGLAGAHPNQLSWEAPSVALNKGTLFRLRVSGSAVVRASAAIVGRRLGA